MRRILIFSTLFVVFALVLTAVPVWAGSPHFVGSCTVTRIGNTLCSSGKEAGLGDEAQVHIRLSFDAACINPGDKHPKAANKEAFSFTTGVPVQNGQAHWPPPPVCGTATFQPDCTPPMSVQFSNITITDVTNGITCNVVGP